jgi:hypothetical protein
MTSKNKTYGPVRADPTWNPATRADPLSGSSRDWAWCKDTPHPTIGSHYGSSPITKLPV